MLRLVIYGHEGATNRIATKDREQLTTKERRRKVTNALIIPKPRQASRQQCFAIHARAPAECCMRWWGISGDPLGNID